MYSTEIQSLVLKIRVVFYYYFGTRIAYTANCDGFVFIVKIIFKQPELSGLFFLLLLANVGVQILSTFNYYCYVGRDAKRDYRRPDPTITNPFRRGNRWNKNSKSKKRNGGRRAPRPGIDSERK